VERGFVLQRKYEVVTLVTIIIIIIISTFINSARVTQCHNGAER